ncbi:MAG: UTP--glucose-1-phosphate uridylyltransferase GalU [Rhodospirillales bacterium]|nr:UTP--glucose-1-phosphate uridylyltransferase GalU [Rhodospirillales bacterium]MCB9964926.1 UTP--glucose-1-phosphate uridylyltransferase GalU [Rhodospirillales bacterium]MCB9973720.1 UTP--glucose-1-phosphate uridylyltransferase GalU [Rhodospirillales bacterium]
MTAHQDFKPVRKAVFPVAGLGTRFLPVTKVLPKEMLPINDRPLIQHVVEEARQAGIEEFIFVTGRHKEMLEEHFDYQPELMETLKQRNKEDELQKVRDSQMPEGRFFLTRQAKPLGLGHAVWCARQLVGNEPFAVLLPDELIQNEVGCLAQMVEVYNQRGGNIVAVEEVSKEETQNYGIVDTADDTKQAIVSVKGLVEKPKPENAPSNLSIIGRYILQPEVFESLSAFETGAGGEIQLTDSMAKLIGDQPFHAMKFKGFRHDAGRRAGFIKANMAYGLADPKIGRMVRNEILKLADQIRENEKLRGVA